MILMTTLDIFTEPGIVVVFEFTPIWGPQSCSSCTCKTAWFLVCSGREYPGECSPVPGNMYANFTLLIPICQDV